MVNLTQWYGSQRPSEDYRDVKDIYRELRAAPWGETKETAQAVVEAVCEARGGRTRHEILETLIRGIIRNHWNEIRDLPRTGLRGGHNAVRIPGWRQSPSGEVSKCFRAVRGPADSTGTYSLPSWLKGYEPHGSGITPTTYIPECCWDEAYKAWQKVFCRRG